mgnify:CR=1 FL=1
MIIVFDVGNTETTIGIFDGEALRAHWRITTGVVRTAGEYRVLLTALVRSAGVAPATGTARNNAPRFFRRASPEVRSKTWSSSQTAPHQFQARTPRLP